MVTQADRIDMLHKAIKHHARAQEVNNNEDDRNFWLETIVYWSNSLLGYMPSVHEITTALGHTESALGTPTKRATDRS